MCSASTKNPSGISGQRDTTFQPYQEQTLLQAGRCAGIVGIELSPFNQEQIMSYHFIDKKDPRIDVMFQGLEKMEKMLSVMEKYREPSSTVNASLRTRNFPKSYG